MNVLAASQLFIAQIDKSRSPLTTETYTYSIRAFVRYVTPEAECSSLSLKDFTGFVTDVLKGSYAPSTMGLYAVVIRRFMKFLVSEDLAGLNFQDFLKIEYVLEECRSERPPRKPKVPTDAEVQAVMQVAYASELVTPLRQRNVALIEVLICTGCRISEIAGLTIGDIDIETGEATILGKGRKVRTVYLTPRALEACQTYWRMRGDTAAGSPMLARHDDGAGKAGPLQKIATTGLRQVINELRLRAGVKEFSPHSCRHYHATKLLRATGNLAIVQEALGHARPDTTRVYAQVDAETVRWAVQHAFGEPPAQPVAGSRQGSIAAGDA